jgi:hypothetical protein
MLRKLVTLMCGLALFGCAETGGGETGESSQAVVHHSAAQLSSLAAGQLLKIDLRDTATIHIVDFAARTDLAKVQVDTAADSFLLDEIAPALSSDQHTLVLGADQAAINAYSGVMDAQNIVIGSDVARDARIKLRTCDGCVDPTGIGPVVCDADPPRCSGD